MAGLPFNDRNGKIFYDDKLVDWNEAQTHLLSHGLHYSTSVFEGERAYNGNIFKSRQHTQRLLHSAQQIFMPLELSEDFIENAKHETLNTMGLKNAYIRAFAWFGGEQMGIDTSQCKTHFAVAVWDDWESYFDPAERMKGISLATVPTRRPPPNTMRVHAKSAGNYQISVCAKREAQKLGAYDALMLDWENNVAESSGANLFFMKDGRLVTPSADRFLNGITRQTVIALAKAEGLEIDDTRRIRPEELMQADEIFLTGTAAEISGVRSIKHEDGETYNFEIGPVTRRMMDAYGDLVRS